MAVNHGLTAHVDWHIGHGKSTRHYCLGFQIRHGSTACIPMSGTFDLMRLASSPSEQILFKFRRCERKPSGSTNGVRPGTVIDDLVAFFNHSSPDNLKRTEDSQHHEMLLLLSRINTFGKGDKIALAEKFTPVLLIFFEQ
jgi:hypothetical protein